MDINIFNKMAIEHIFDCFAVSDMDKYHFVIYNNLAKCEALNDLCNAEGHVVLNLYPAAVRDLKFNDDNLSMNIRFKGVPTHVVIPYYAMPVYIMHFDKVGLVQLPTGVIYLAEEPVGEPEHNPHSDNVVSLFGKN